jgi:DNA repair protein RadC
MKLFTKAIDKQLFEQYKYGSDLSRQKVVAKIFNPYGRGVWYLLNSDPADPDYIWAIVDLFSVEIGSVSRSELETVRVPPFRLPLERDMSFYPIPANQLYVGSMSGKRYEEGGLFESDEDDDEDDDEDREEGDNARMLQNQVKSIIHHAKELSEITDDIDKVDPWVITKAQRAATDLADITHYLDGNKGKYAKGGQLELFPPEMDDFNAWWEPKGSKPLSEYVYDDPVVKILIGPEGKEQFGVSYTSAEDAWAYIRSYMRGFWDEPSRFAIQVPGEVLKIVKKTVMEDGGMMAKGGVMYPNLSDMPTNVVNEPTEKEKKRGVIEKNVPEIDIKLTKNEKLTNIQIRSSDDAERAFRRIWDVDSMNVQESMYVLYLNKANRILGYSQHSIGGITGTVLDIQIIAATSVKALAKGIIVAHNHPSGNLLPSTSDIQISEKLKQALKLFEIYLVDSMILVPQQGHTSLADEGRLADGGMTEVKYQIVNNEGKYYSQSMTSYKPVFNASPYMGYTYTMDEAEKLIKQLEQQGYEGLQIVKYQSSFFDMADGGMMAKGGKTDFNTLAEKIAASYEGKKVKPAYQHKYGKRYDKEEAMQVGRATAAVIERRKGRM